MARGSYPMILETPTGPRIILVTGDLPPGCHYLSSGGSYARRKIRWTTGVGVPVPFAWPPDPPPEEAPPP